MAVVPGGQAAGRFRSPPEAGSPECFYDRRVAAAGGYDRTRGRSIRRSHSCFGPDWSEKAEAASLSSFFLGRFSAVVMGTILTGSLKAFFEALSCWALTGGGRSRSLWQKETEQLIHYDCWWKGLSYCPALMVSYGWDRPSVGARRRGIVSSIKSFYFTSAHWLITVVTWLGLTDGSRTKWWH